MASLRGPTNGPAEWRELMAGKAKGLFKTRIIVWSRYDPSAREMDINDLVRDGRRVVLPGPAAVGPRARSR